MGEYKLDGKHPVVVLVDGKKHTIYNMQDGYLSISGRKMFDTLRETIEDSNDYIEELNPPNPYRKEHKGTYRDSRKRELTIPDGHKERGFNESVRTKSDYDKVIQQEFIDFPEIYKQLANKVTKAKAKAIMDKGLAFAEAEFPKLLERMDATAIALGDLMAREYSNMGEYDKAVTVIRDMARQLTKAGQFSQAAVIALTKSNPMTALAYAKRDIAKLNTDGHIVLYSQPAWYDVCEI
ncbi:MAG: hypothetical protein IJO54_01290 [Oscillospiraceae bacterium]|nr:hypothetical protein [Oscillospiraceae bacterium]